MKHPIAAFLLATALVLVPSSARAEEPAETLSAVDALVRQAAAQMNLSLPSGEEQAATQVRNNQFTTTLSQGSLAVALGMEGSRKIEAEDPPAFHKLRGLKFRRGRIVRQQRRDFYQEALQELMTEFRRASLVPEEDLAELSKLTGHRPSRIRRDLFRTVIEAPLLGDESSSE